LEFKKWISSWYSFTFNFLKLLTWIDNYQQFINIYFEFHTYITFYKFITSLNDEELVKVYDKWLIIIDEIHLFRNSVGNKTVYKKSTETFRIIIKDEHVLFMPATPIFSNYQEIPSLMKLIKSGFICDEPLAHDNL